MLTDGPTTGSWCKLLSGGKLEYLKYWQYFVWLVLRVLVLWALRVLGVVRKCFQYAQYTGSIKYFSTISLCTAVSISSSAFYYSQHSLFTDGPTKGSWTKFLSGGKHEYLEYWLLCREYMLRALEIFTGLTLLILWVLQPLLMFVLRVLLVVHGVLYCSSFCQSSQYLGLQ